MKEIKAIIRPARLDDVREALRHVPGFPGMTISKVEGCSAPSRHRPQSWKEELIDYSPKVRIEIVCDDEHAEDLRAALIAGGATGNVGDGIVWMTEAAAFGYLWRPEDDDGLSTKS